MLISIFETLAQRPGFTSVGLSGAPFPGATAGWYQLRSAWSAAQ
jgi:hypothetical protein